MLAKDLTAPVKVAIRGLVEGERLRTVVRVLNRIVAAGHRSEVRAIVRGLVRSGHPELRPYLRRLAR